VELAKRNAFGIKVVASSLILGIAGDLILSNEGWGLSLPLFAAFLIGQVLILTRITDQKPSRTSLALLGAAFLFSLCFLWRDAPELKFINGLAVFALVGLAAVHATGKKLQTAPIIDFTISALGYWLLFIADFFTLLFNDVKWAEALKKKGMAGTNAVIRGLAIAVPLLIVFGALLISADTAFKNLFDHFVSIDPDAAFTHGFIILSCSVLTGGLLRHLFLATDAPPKPPIASQPFVLAPSYHPPYHASNPLRLGATEFGIILGSLNLLFGLFVLVQAPYLFGGAAHVTGTHGLSYAEYARHGFFELVWVIGLAIPVLIGTHAVINSESPVAERVWRGMALVMVSLLFVVMQSAILRMRLYVDLYSLTTERIYVLASLGWMGLMLLWFVTTTVRAKPERFGFGAFASLLGVILVVNVMNPDAQIVRFNVEQAKPGKAIDGSYLMTLSADATPDLIRYRAKLDPETRAGLESGWRASKLAHHGQWRSWDISRALADIAIESNQIDAVAAKQ
jgi:hypothetical protein